MLGVMRYDRAIATDKHRVRYRGYAVSPIAFIVVVTQLRPRKFKIFHCLQPRLFALVHRHTDYRQTVSMLGKQLLDSGH